MAKAKRKMPPRVKSGPNKGQFRKRASARKAPARKGKRRTTRKNPGTAPKQRRTYQRTAQMNPKRRRRTTRSNPRRRSMRSNPRQAFELPSMDQLTEDLIMPAAAGTVGAIGNDMLFTYIPYPDTFRASRWSRWGTKGAQAIALTVLAGGLINQRVAAQIGTGAFINLFADIARQLMLQNDVAAEAAVEGMGFYTSGMGYYNPALPAGGGEMGVYVPGGQRSGRTLPSLTSPDNVGSYQENGYSYA